MSEANKLISTNPAKSYEVIGEVEISSEEEIKNKVNRAREAYKDWKEMGVKKRIERLRPLVGILESQQDEFAELITNEMGKPISESKSEAAGAIKKTKWYLDNSEKNLEEIIFENDKNLNKVVYEPFGVTAIVLPWNYPLSIFIGGVIPNLIAGNTVVLKHSENCPLLGVMAEKAMAELDLPDGVFSEVFGDGEVGEQLINENIDLVMFTGSTSVGQKIYSTAGKKFIKSVMELGGSNPGIVMPDANLEGITPMICDKRYFNCGQVCNALKRLIVHESIFNKLIDNLKEKLVSMKVGDPMDRETNISSLVSKRQLDVLVSQVDEAVKNGAKIEIGGSTPKDLLGAYYLPTILTNITREMRVWREEVFGPVLSVVTFKNEDEAIELANDTLYGLGANVYTSDLSTFVRIAEKIETGGIKMNSGIGVSEDPFGGYKKSGIGRIGGKFIYREICQLKSISIEK